MSTIVEWPTYLNPATNQQEPLPPPQWDSMQIDVQDILLRSQMDSGPPKLRRRFTGASRYFTCSFVYTYEQSAAFVAWYEGALGHGANRFNWITPYGNNPCVASFRKPFTVAPASSIIHNTTGGYHMLWKFTCDIEIHP